jgi:hypothetical protein
MTCQPYHDLPPDPTGRSPRGICWKVSPSGRLRSGWASRSGRYTSDWSASERTCASNWRNRGEIPSQSPLGGYSSLAVATTIIGRRRRACLPQTLRRMMDRTMRTSTRLFAKALGLAIATTAALCITPNALSQDTGLHGVVECCEQHRKTRICTYVVWHFPPPIGSIKTPPVCTPPAGPFVENCGD